MHWSNLSRPRFDQVLRFWPTSILVIHYEWFLAYSLHYDLLDGLDMMMACTVHLQLKDHNRRQHAWAPMHKIILLDYWVKTPNLSITDKKYKKIQGWDILIVYMFHISKALDILNSDPYSPPHLQLKWWRFHVNSWLLSHEMVNHTVWTWPVHHCW